MIRLLRKLRRGQIRGIDFSLAMIIFVLTMSQVLVLTSTFIENSQSSQDVSSDLSTTQNFANQILTTPGVSGTDTNWDNLPTASLDPNWNFGLSNGNGSIDPFKLGRLANNSESGYLLDYATIKSASSLNRDFEIRVKATIDVKILSTITISATDIQVVGRVTRSSSGLGDASVQLFSLEPTSQAIQQLTVRTNSTGYFDQIIQTDTSSPFQVVVAIASYGIGNQDIDYSFHSGRPTDIINQTLLRGSSTQGFTIDVNTEITNPDIYAFYSGFGANNSLVTSGSTISVPETGLSLILTTDGNEVALSTYPLVMDDYLYSSISPSDPTGTQTTAIERLINVRGVLLRFSLITWS